MPYQSKSELPDAVKKLPAHAQDIWMSAYNAAYKQYDGDEGKSNATAWAAVKKKYAKGSDGKWHKKVERNSREQSMPKQQIVDTIASKVQLITAIGESDGTQRHRARFLVSRADEKNGNGRLYPKHVWERESRKVSEGKVVITGQSRHPNYDIDVLDTFLRFEALPMDGKSLYGESLIIETSKGRDFIEIAKDAPEIISVSTRGRGSMKKGKDESGNEVQVVQDDYELEGIDIIFKGYQSFKDGSMLAFEALTPEAATAAQQAAEVAETEPEPAPEPQSASESVAAEQEPVTDAEPAPEPEPTLPNLDTLLKPYVTALALAEKNVTALEKRVTFTEDERDTAQKQLAATKAAFTTEQEAHNETKAKLARTDAHITELEGQRAARDFLVQEARGRKFYGALIARLWDCQSVDEVKAKLPDAETIVEAQLSRLAPDARALLAFTEELDTETESTTEANNWRTNLVRPKSKK